MAKKITADRTKEALVEGVKELVRVVLLAIIPVILIGLENGNGVDFRLVLLTGAIAALRFVDKALHELGKSTNNETLERGLTRF